MTATASGLRLLLADDNADAAESLGLLLEMAGHEVELVYSGADAVRAASAAAPDAALLDIGMPGVSGYEAARQIREQAGCRETVLIALTGWGQAEDRRRSADAGFQHHLVKPIDPAELNRILASLKRRGG
jgi:CheY-like chemotaxis protein